MKEGGVEDPKNQGAFRRPKRPWKGSGLGSRKTGKKTGGIRAAEKTKRPAGLKEGARRKNHRSGRAGYQARKRPGNEKAITRKKPSKEGEGRDGPRGGKKHG
jgi:hypothetical protein